MTEMEEKEGCLSIFQMLIILWLLIILVIVLLVRLAEYSL